MKELSQQFNETINLAILDRDEIIYLYSMGSDNTLKLDLRIGSNQPAYCAAVGESVISLLKRAGVRWLSARSKIKILYPLYYCQ